MTTRRPSQAMTIGRFAQLSGLSIKALRRYDETGVLEPAHVDPDTGYRWYHAGQARPGAVIGVLRSMGVPLEVVREVLAEPDRTEELVARWRTGLAADRARQDDAIAIGLMALADYGRDVEVVRRKAPEQHYVGLPVEAHVLGSDSASGAAAMEAGWQSLDRLVTSAGRTASSAWTTIHPEDGRRKGRIVLCLGLDQALPDNQTESPYGTGVLPARTELAVVLTPDSLSSSYMESGEGVPPAALIALMDALDRDEAAAGTIRQTPLLDEAKAGFAGLEVSVALEAPA